MSGDGLVVRVRAPVGRLIPDQTRRVAEMALRFGNGLIDLTSRAHVQIRGVAEKDHSALIDSLAKYGLVDDSVEKEARKNIMVQPFWQEDDATHLIADMIAVALSSPGAPDLPGKFGFAIDTGPLPLLRNNSADIRIERVGDHYLVRADGSENGVLKPAKDVAHAAIDLAHWFLASGGAPEGRGRMAKHIAGGAKLPNWLASDRQSDNQAEQPFPGPTNGGQLVALEFGQIAAKALHALADHSDIHLTPWRMLFLKGLGTAPDLPGLITDPSDPRLRVSVCTGAPGCRQGLSSTRALARELAPNLGAHQHLHISGCTKGCAHPGPAPLTLTATGPDHFNLIHKGRAGDTPAATGLAPDDIEKAIQNAP